MATKKYKELYESQVLTSASLRAKNSKLESENKELKKDNNKLINQLLTLVGDGLDMMKVVKNAKTS